jgi:hypothetical protein
VVDKCSKNVGRCNKNVWVWIPIVGDYRGVKKEGCLKLN